MRTRPAQSSPWVLVTDGGRGQARSTLATVRALAAGGYRVAVTESGGSSLAGASRHCSRRVEVSRVDTDPGRYASDIRRELSERPYLDTLATADAALVALGFPVADLIDKRRLAGPASAAGLPSPQRLAFEGPHELPNHAAGLPYPAVVKSVIPNGGVFKVDSAVGLGDLPLADGPVIVEPFIANELSSVAGVMWQGRLVAAVRQRYERIWPLDCGGACAAETVAPDPVAEAGLGRLLAGFEGVFQAQFAGRYLIDLNPRPYGSIPLAVAAGVNLPVIYCRLLSGYPPPKHLLRGRAGVRFRWLEGDLRHAIARCKKKEIGAMTALRIAAPKIGSANGPESLTDPGPTLRRAIFAAERLVRPEGASPRPGYIFRR